MLTRKIPVYLVFLLTTIAAIITYVVLSSFFQPTILPVQDKSLSRCDISRTRLSGFQYIHPLLYVDVHCEAESLLPVKNELTRLIGNYAAEGTISVAAVYLRDLNQGDWISIGENEKFNPGSLMKVPELICFMKMNQKQPGLLEKRIAYPQPLITDKKAHYLSKSIVPGHTYTIRELLYYMIAYSDNNATMVLNQIMDTAVFKKVFTDLGLQEPNMAAHDIPISAREYSLFMRILYNATYLSNQESEYCTELLTHSDFEKGMISGLPANIPVAHKFGEAGDNNNLAHFSESGIIYIGNSPYLLTVMTKGRSMDNLPSVIAAITKKTFEQVSSRGI